MWACLCIMLLSEAHQKWEKEHRFAFRIESQIHWMCLLHWHCVCIKLLLPATKIEITKETAHIYLQLNIEGTETHTVLTVTAQACGKQIRGQLYQMSKKATRTKKNSRNPASEPTPPPTLGIGGEGAVGCWYLGINDQMLIWSTFPIRLCQIFFFFRQMLNVQAQK